MTAPRPYIPRLTTPAPAPETKNRSMRSEIRIWWREIDRVLLMLVLALMAIGNVAVAIGSHASATRLSTAEKSLPDLYFYEPHVAFQLAGLVVLVAFSTLSRENARRFGILLCAATLFLLVLVPIPGIGHTQNGAQRWLNLGIRFQPSELLKPAFALTMAWILSWRLRDPNLPVIPIATGLMGLIGLLLMLQPNLGDTLLFAGVWFVMLLIAGIPMKWVATIGAVSLVAGVGFYTFYENGRNRINDFLFGGTAFDQVDLAEKTLLNGGWTGSGMWLGTRKLKLPEAHTDYILSVIGEEFGLLTCAIVVLLFLAIIVRVLVRQADEENLFALLAGAGLVSMIGGQAFLNILVNLRVLPSTGSTLPLVSYGGSSTLAICMTVGLLLAITRRNPFLSSETPGLAAAISKKMEHRA